MSSNTGTDGSTAPCGNECHDGRVPFWPDARRAFWTPVRCPICKGSGRMRLRAGEAPDEAYARLESASFEVEK